jgi:hypothetical protein
MAHCDGDIGRTPQTVAEEKRRLTGYTFDAGPLIALDRRNRTVAAMITLAKKNAWRIVIPAGALAQAARDLKRQAHLSLLLNEKLTIVEPLSDTDALAVGKLLAATGTRDVVDAHVAICANRYRQPIVTSDPDDLRRLSPGTPLISI